MILKPVTIRLTICLSKVSFFQLFIFLTPLSDIEQEGYAKSSGIGAGLGRSKIGGLFKKNKVIEKEDMSHLPPGNNYKLLFFICLYSSAYTILLKNISNFEQSNASGL